MTATLKQRKTYFDVIKVIAIILVIFNHTGGEGYRESRKSRIVVGLLAAFSIVYTVIRCTFGIYLFHGYVLKASEKILIKGGYGTAWVRVAVIFAVTLVIVMGLRRLPGVRKVL